MSRQTWKIPQKANSTIENWEVRKVYHLPTRLLLPFVILVVNFKPPWTCWCMLIIHAWVPIGLSLAVHLTKASSFKITQCRASCLWSFIDSFKGKNLLLCAPVCFCSDHMYFNSLTRLTPLLDSFFEDKRLWLCTLGLHGCAIHICWHEWASTCPWPVLCS